MPPSPKILKGCSLLALLYLLITSIIHLSNYYQAKSQLNTILIPQQTADAIARPELVMGIGGGVMWLVGGVLYYRKKYGWALGLAVLGIGFAYGYMEWLAIRTGGGQWK